MSKSISDEMIRQTYEYAKKVYHGQIGLGKALDEIVSSTDMKRGSALAYVHVFGQMMIGNEYRRTMKTRATEYFLLNIQRDYGEDQLKKALQSVSAHVKYYATLGHGGLRSIEKLVQRLSV